MGAHAAAAEPMDALYEKAKLEKALVFYAGGPTAPYGKIVAAFERQYPGVKVTFSGGFSNVLNERIEKQLQAGRLEVDMALFQTAQDFVAWKKRGVLMSFHVDGHEAIMPAFKDPDGAYTTAKVTAVTYAYNTSHVAPQDVPKSALDFLKPQFAGKIITCYPADDDATLYAFYGIVQTYGWSYMDAFMANKPNFVQGHLGVARSIASGENHVTFDATTSTVGALKQSGAPIELKFSEQDSTPFFTLTAGIFKDAPHPNAAKLFLNWYMSVGQQTVTGVFSSRMDVSPPVGFRPLASYNAALDYGAFVSNEPLMNDLRKRFEAYTGPVVNKGGVQ
jgi:ABC-type Fe3+ transport system substrate-binding protein